jgi:hypothetical protein
MEKLFKNQDNLLEFLRKILSIIRPKFHNRIAWVVVAVGLSIVAQPAWLPIVEELIIYHINPSYFRLERTGEVYGFWLCISGLLYHFLCTAMYSHLEKFHEFTLQKSRREHDSVVFLKVDNIVSEQELAVINERLLSQHSLTNAQSQKLEELASKLSLSSNSFLMPEINSCSLNLMKAVIGLNKFLINNFDMFPYKQMNLNYKICMNPRLNPDQLGSWETDKEYSALEKELQKFIEKLDSAYKSFRMSVKSNLYL